MAAKSSSAGTVVLSTEMEQKAEVLHKALSGLGEFNYRSIDWLILLKLILQFKNSPLFSIFFSRGEYKSICFSEKCIEYFLFHIFLYRHKG